MTFPSDANDTAIILRLTRENEALRLAVSALQGDLNLISKECDTAGVPQRTDDEHDSHDIPSRVRLLREQIAEAIANTPKATCWQGYSVYQVITPTSIDDVDDVVIARSEEAVRKWYTDNDQNPIKGFHLQPGPYQVKIERLSLSFWTEVHVLWEGQGERKANWPTPTISSSTTPQGSPSSP